ncbi:MAG TPA: hypothetical protein DEH78_28930, partial [Solibacterales bacterium]|nr:hypothetical protein [Bryobacterales bacterium]
PPVVPVTDLTIQGNDLVAATQGRAFWILDDVTPLEQWALIAQSAKVHLFAPRAAARISYAAGGRRVGGGPR